MKLSEVKTEDRVKLLLYGDPGEGKTVFAASFPGPIKFFDFDGKADSAALFFKDNPEVLENVDVVELAGNLVEDPIVNLNKIINEELIPQQKTGEMHFKTLVLDSITTFSRAVLNHIVKTNPGIKRNQTKQGVQPGLQDYGILKREFAKLIPGLLSLPCNVVMTAHMDTQKDEVSGEIIRGPIMDGAFSAQLPIYFKEVWRLYTEKDQRLAQTQSNYKYKCRSQIPGLPNPLDVGEGFSALAKYL